MIFLTLLALSIYSIYKYNKTEDWSIRENAIIASFLSTILTITVALIGPVATKTHNYGETDKVLYTERIKNLVIKNNEMYYIDTSQKIKQVNSPFLHQNNKPPTLVTIDQNQFNWFLIPWPTSSTQYILHGEFQIKEVTK